MGLDMYMYVATTSIAEGRDPEASPRELGYRRKHPNLHGWMQLLWQSQGNQGEFNGNEIELTWQDIDHLEHAVQSGTLPATMGFFFGEDSDQYYCEADLEFVINARAELFMGLRVFYNSSW